MSAGRTVTVPTLDHGDITIPEPAWCTGHDGARPQYRSDTGHTGTAFPLVYEGAELGTAMLVQDPFAVHADRSIKIYVELGGNGVSLDPVELETLANSLVGYSTTLRELALQLAVLHTEEGQ
ncbi:hypothetical protein [Streptomyces sp. B1I3]|uniref:DUF6907 domain-containing protein n=1 Tax=Streptomyces sp. B1I3 TaxID=3042264 RepID=UPI0027890F50|nr:hypothetical protein [Streptomyces sp. B1I3]MDQ0795594.1 hypothetical protein [Streptomyces sp. B1I3]